MHHCICSKSCYVHNILPWHRDTSHHSLIVSEQLSLFSRLIWLVPARWCSMPLVLLNLLPVHNIAGYPLYVVLSWCICHLDVGVCRSVSPGVKLVAYLGLWGFACLFIYPSRDVFRVCNFIGQNNSCFLKWYAAKRGNARASLSCILY